MSLLCGDDPVGEGDPMHDVFISYRWVSPEQEWVRDELFPALRAAGLRPFLDVEDFVPGRDIMLEMNRAGMSSRRALCVLSPAYFDGNRMVGFESLMARRQDPSGSESRLIPLILRPTSVPEWMRGLVPVDWTGADARARAREWRKLLKVLGAEKERLDTPPPSPLARTDAELESQDVRSAAQPQITNIKNGMVRFVLSRDGEIMGGKEALRRVFAELLHGDWQGEVEIHHALLDCIHTDIGHLLANDGLSADEGKELQRLRSQADFITGSIDTVRLAVKLTFASTSGEECAWGVPMNLETAIDVLAGLFVEAQLTPASGTNETTCRLYVPDRTRDPICIDVLLPEDEVKTFRQSWEQSLAPFDDCKWRSWDWPDLVPLWHLKDEFIAVRLLPAIVMKFARKVLGQWPVSSPATQWWEHLRSIHTAADRDPLNPYHWCLALQKGKTCKDLAWKTSPPPHAYELASILGWQR